MKKNIIFGLTAALALAMGLTGCSDNYNELLEPMESQRTLSLKVDNSGYSNGKLNLGAAPSNTTVQVICNTRWAAEVTDCDGGWCEIDRFSGIADGTFTISVRENMRELRTCYVKVYKVDAEGKKDLDASYDITVTQEASDVRLTPSSVEPFAAENPRTQSFEIVSNVAWTLTITYETEATARFITVKPTSGIMNQENPTRFTGSGDAGFDISLEPNRQAANRSATITLESEVGKYSVDIEQVKSLYTFDVDPYQPQSVPVTGGKISFGILSLSDWDIATAADWIGFSRASGSASETRQEVIADIEPNTTGRERVAEIYFRPRDSRYEKIMVSVTQTSFNYFFNVSPTGNFNIIPEEGGDCTLSLSSSFNWEITVPSWVHINRNNKGSGSDRPEDINYITLRVDRNESNTTLSGIVTVSPLPTELNNMEIHPDTLNVEPVYISIAQFGGTQAAISIPWIVGDYTQTSATVAFNYYSPYYPITNAGIKWREYGSDSWNTIESPFDNPISGTVTVTLINLSPATQYEVCGFVMDNRSNNVILGKISLPFTTAGQRPEEPDNPTPSNIRKR